MAVSFRNGARSQPAEDKWLGRPLPPRHLSSPEQALSVALSHPHAYDRQLCDELRERWIRDDYREELPTACLSTDSVTSSSHPEASRWPRSDLSVESSFCPVRSPRLTYIATRDRLLPYSAAAACSSRGSLRGFGAGLAAAGGYGHHSLSNPRPLPPPRQNSRPGPTP